jgi:adenylate cyclase
MGRLVTFLQGLRPSGRQLIRLAISAVPLLVFIPHALGLWPIEFLTRVENYLYDVRVRLTLEDTVDPRVVIVDIDEVSMAAEGRWPWRRDKLAALANRLFDDYGVRVVGFDVFFAEPEETTALALLDELERNAGLTDAQREQLRLRRPAYETDRLFAESLIARDVVLGFAFKSRVGPNEPARVGVLPTPVQLPGSADVFRLVRAAGYTGNLAVLQEAATAGGFFDTPLTDDDGIVRRTPLFQTYEGKLYESLSFAVARISLGSPPIKLAFAGTEGERRLAFVDLGKSRIPVDRNSGLLMPFRGPVGSFPYVSATHVIKGSAPKDLLAGRIVLIGTSAPGLLDIRPTPVAKEYIGVEAHANLVAGILDSAIRYRPSIAPRIEVGALLVLGLIAALWLARLSPLHGLLQVLVLVAVWTTFNLLAWTRNGIVLALTGPIAYLFVTSLLQLAFSYFVEIRRRRRIARMFGQYAPPEIVTELDASEAEIVMGGVSREMSVLFTDVRGFTTLSEGLEPRALSQLMNEFLTPITEVIHRTGHGTIDKYMGDAVMAFWGALPPDPEHPRHAVLAALGIVERMRELKPAFEARGWPAINIGVGVSTGMMNVGNMGSAFRAAYTVLGDAVNLGSRLEGLTKQYGVDIIVSGPTATAVREIVFRELDRVRVKGKQEPVAILEPIGRREALAATRIEAIERFGAMLEHYRAQRWHEALDILNPLARAGSEPLYQIYLERIARCRAFPPPRDWDGVFVFETK